MSQKSIFKPGHGMDLHGGLDRNLGAPGIAHSNLPEHIANVEVESDEEMGTVVDCDGKDAGKDVCLIKKAEDEAAARANAAPPRTSKARKRELPDTSERKPENPAMANKESRFKRHGPE